MITVSHADLRLMIEETVRANNTTQRPAGKRARTSSQPPPAKSNTKSLYYRTKTATQSQHAVVYTLAKVHPVYQGTTNFLERLQMDGWTFHQNDLDCLGLSYFLFSDIAGNYSWPDSTCPSDPTPKTPERSKPCWWTT
jgi:hypothetical protein